MPAEGKISPGRYEAVAGKKEEKTALALTARLSPFALTAAGGIDI